MLNTAKTVGFAATAKPTEAKRFYQHSLGLELTEESPFALVFRSGNTTVRIQIVPTVISPPYTSLGWEVADIQATVQQLASRGVEFQFFEGLPQNDDGIWSTPDGAQIAWFLDPDGNTLSLTEHGSASAS